MAGQWSFKGQIRSDMVDHSAVDQVLSRERGVALFTEWILFACGVAVSALVGLATGPKHLIWLILLLVAGIVAAAVLFLVRKREQGELQDAQRKMAESRNYAQYDATFTGGQPQQPGTTTNPPPAPPAS